MRFAFERGGRLAVDQQHGGRHRQVDDRIAAIVGLHGVGIEVGLDQVLAGDGEIDVELLLRANGPAGPASIVTLPPGLPSADQ